MQLRFVHALFVSLALHGLLAGGTYIWFDYNAEPPGRVGTFEMAVTALIEDSAGGAQDVVEQRPQVQRNVQHDEAISVKKSEQQTAAQSSAKRASIVAPSVQSREGSESSRLASSQTGVGDGGSVGGERARIVSAPRPEYPFRARQAGFEGKVVLDVTIAADGQVDQVEIVESSGRDDCDQAARIALRDRWRFAPATYVGEPISSHERVVVRFRLIGR